MGNLHGSVQACGKIYQRYIGKVRQGRARVKQQATKQQATTNTSNGAASRSRSELLSRLKRLLGAKGSIVRYNAPFERARIKEPCNVYPKSSLCWEKIELRIADLLKPFRGFHYYRPAQELLKHCGRLCVPDSNDLRN